MAIRRHRRTHSNGMTPQYVDMLEVGSLTRGASKGWLRMGSCVLPCALGRTGRTFSKREGDGGTPSGCWRPLIVLYRADRVARPRTGLPVRPIRPSDGWCDAPGDGNYNRVVRHPYPASAERLWRQDALYDLIVVLDHNQRPRIQGAGSAIFMHVARTGYQPTEGCVALSHRHLLHVLARMSDRTRLRIA
jgi:L,D-peptidoglycan transpeptidase YkuD (ErfK/YbiS/YcfS/YnhG family)